MYPRDAMHENHNMAFIFGQEMADALAVAEARKAAVPGAAEQVAWVDGLA